MAIWCLEVKVLFSDALNTFYLRLFGVGKEMFYLTMYSTQFFLQLYGVGHMVTDNSDSKKGNLLLPLHKLFFFIISKGSFICTIPQTG